MTRFDRPKLEVRARNYEKIFKEEDIMPEELHGDGLNYLSSRGPALSHAHFMTLQMKELYKDGETKYAFYLLGMVEIILSSYELLPAGKRLY